MSQKNGKDKKFNTKQQVKKYLKLCRFSHINMALFL